MATLFGVFFLFLANQQLVLAQNQSYCNTTNYGLYAGDGTLCKYTPGKAGPACGIIIRGQDMLTMPVMNFIVGLHNTLRQGVAAGNESRGSPGPQPSAINMTNITWNAQLALAAQTWANQCKIQSDANRNETTAVVTSATSNPVYVGQNIYAYVDTPETYNYNNFNTAIYYWEQAIMRWYNEVAHFNRSVVMSYTYQKTAGHYAQIVAGSTTVIGCGFNQWRLRNSNRIVRILICNYGPGGLIPGVPVYATLQ